MEVWLAYTGKARLEAPLDWEEVRKGHGRIEQRQLWLVPCEGEMQTYLEKYFGWPKVQ